MELNKLSLNKVILNRVQLNTVGALANKAGSKPPEPDITDAILTEKKSLLLMENGKYLKQEKPQVKKSRAKSMPKIDKSYWKFIK